MDNGKCIPDSTEHIAQRDNYASLVSRIVVENINCLEFLKEHAVRHIKHTQPANRRRFDVETTSEDDVESTSKKG
jgi:hypothetical protein